jgi:hypothetical protein
MVEALPVNECLSEPGVVLVNKYAELKEQASDIEEEMSKVKEGIIDYARQKKVEVIRGSDFKVRVKLDKKLKFPSKSEPAREELDRSIIKADKWMEVSQLDTSVLTRIVEGNQWDKNLIDEVIKYGRIEEINSVYLSKLKEED